MDLKNDLKSKVKFFGREYNTGKISSDDFFDKVDEFIKTTPAFFDYLFSKIKLDFDKGVNIVLSGEFGEIFLNQFSDFFEENLDYKIIREFLLIPSL